MNQPRWIFVILMFLNASLFVRSFALDLLNPGGPSTNGGYIEVQPESGRACLKTQEVWLGKLPIMPALPAAMVSADCQHVAFPSKHGIKWSVYYDGDEGERYGRVHSLTFSATGSRFAYVGEKSQSNAVVVLDGEEGKSYEGIAPDSFKFSPDGSRYAYVIGLPFTNSAKTETGKLWAASRVVVDGTESRNYASLATRDLVFSADGKHLAYRASLQRVLSSNHTDVVVRDGVDSRPYKAVLDGTPVFSPDSQHLAFAGLRDGKWFVVQDDKESAPWDAVANDTVVFTPDSQRLIYRAKRGKNWFVMLGGKELIRNDDGVPQIAIFGPDNQHIAILFTAESKDHWLVDRVPGPAFDQVTTLVFSPDSRRTFYTGRRAHQWSAVIDGAEGPTYELVGDTGSYFSKDSKHVAYLCQRDNKYHLVLDGKEGPEYDWMGRVLVFSSDSQHVAFLAGRGALQAGDQQPEQTFIVVDGRETKPYVGIVPNLAFVGNKTVRAIALRFNDQTLDLELVQVESEVPED